MKKRILGAVLGAAVLAGAGGCGAASAAPASTPHPVQANLPAAHFQVLTRWAADPDASGTSQQYVEVRFVRIDGNCYLEADDPGGDDGIENATFSPVPSCPPN